MFYRFNAVLIKIPTALFTQTEKTILKFIWKHKRPTVAKGILNGVEGYVGSILILDFETYFKAKTAWYWHTDRHIDKWNRIQKLIHIHSQLSFHRGGKNIQWCWKNWKYINKRLKHLSLPLPEHKNQFKIYQIPKC